MSFTHQKQKLLVEYLISSADTYALCQHIIQPTYFDPDLRQAVEFIHDYYERFSAMPAAAQVLSECDVELEHHALTRDQVEYCSQEVEKFCKRKGLEQAIIAASARIANGEGDSIEQMIRDAVTISLNKDLGIDYFDNPEERLALAAMTQQRVSTGWPEMDELLGGGLARGETALFCANSGGGKSITLANLALNMIAQNLNVLYLSFELSESLIAQRFDIMHTGIPSSIHATKQEEIARALKHESGKGKLTIKWMPTGTNSTAIRGYLKEFELKYGYVPDLLLVDYLDLMGTNNKVSADNIWEKDKQATEQLGDVLKAYNMLGATASQLNRSAIDAEELNQGHTAGGISKVNTVDWQIAILHTPAMKAAGEIMFQFLKARSSDATGKKCHLGWNSSKLRIVTKGNRQETPIEKKISEGLPTRSSGNSLASSFFGD